VNQIDGNERLERLERWAAKVVEESGQLSPDISEQELRDHQATWYADFYAANSDWARRPQDDAEMRTFLITQEDMSPELADAVVARLKDLVAAR
jgi:GH43 family beta-xylosidase